MLLFYPSEMLMHLFINGTQFLKFKSFFWRGVHNSSLLTKHRFSNILPSTSETTLLHILLYLQKPAPQEVTASEMSLCPDRFSSFPRPVQREPHAILWPLVLLSHNSNWADRSVQNVSQPFCLADRWSVIGETVLLWENLSAGLDNAAERGEVKDTVSSLIFYLLSVWRIHFAAPTHHTIIALHLIWLWRTFLSWVNCV